MPRSAPASGSAMFTIETSSTIMSWATAMTARASQRRGSGCGPAGSSGRSGTGRSRRSGRLSTGMAAPSFLRGAQWRGMRTRGSGRPAAVRGRGDGRGVRPTGVRAGRGRSGSAHGMCESCAGPAQAVADELLEVLVGVVGIPGLDGGGEGGEGGVVDQRRPEGVAVVGPAADPLLEVGSEAVTGVPRGRRRAPVTARTVSSAGAAARRAAASDRAATSVNASHSGWPARGSARMSRHCWISRGSRSKITASLLGK